MQQLELDQEWYVLEKAYTKMCYTQAMLQMTNTELNDIAISRDCRNLKDVSERIRANNIKLTRPGRYSFMDVGVAGASNRQKWADANLSERLAQLTERMEKLHEEEKAFRLNWARMLRQMHEDASQLAGTYGIVIGGGPCELKQLNPFKENKEDVQVKDTTSVDAQTHDNSVVEEHNDKQSKTDTTKRKWNAMESVLREQENMGLGIAIGGGKHTETDSVQSKKESDDGKQLKSDKLKYEALELGHKEKKKIGSEARVAIGCYQKFKTTCVQVKEKSIEEKQQEIDNTKLELDTLETELCEKERNLEEMQMDTNVQQTILEMKKRELKDKLDALRAKQEELINNQLALDYSQWEKESAKGEPEPVDCKVGSAESLVSMLSGGEESLYAKCWDLGSKQAELASEECALDAEQEELCVEQRKLRELQNDFAQLRSELVVEHERLIEGRSELGAKQRELNEEKRRANNA